MNSQEKIVQKSITDVINRLHHVTGGDRQSLLMEWLEYLIEEEIETTWVEELCTDDEKK